jgi:hypothetical protein
MSGQSPLGIDTYNQEVADLGGCQVCHLDSRSEVEA